MEKAIAFTECLVLLASKTFEICTNETKAGDYGDGIIKTPGHLGTGLLILRRYSSSYKKPRSY
jgi:hypothetical protein